MIERVARAMFQDDHDEPWEQGEERTRMIYLNNARAAIEAMRDPTEAMLHAGRYPMTAIVAERWQAMIDEVLGA